MPRFPRLQYNNAIYHIVTQGDGRRKLFHDQGHYDRFTKGLVDEVDRSNWGIVAYCWMPNHIHALIKTPSRISVGACNAGSPDTPIGTPSGTVERATCSKAGTRPFQ